MSFTLFQVQCHWSLINITVNVQICKCANSLSDSRLASWTSVTKSLTPLRPCQGPTFSVYFHTVVLVVVWLHVYFLTWETRECIFNHLIICYMLFLKCTPHQPWWLLGWTDKPNAESRKLSYLKTPEAKCVNFCQKPARVIALCWPLNRWKSSICNDRLRCHIDEWSSQYSSFNCNNTSMCSRENIPTVFVHCELRPCVKIVGLVSFCVLSSRWQHTKA